MKREMSGFCLNQMVRLLFVIACANGQAVYEDKCIKFVHDMYPFYDRNILLQTQVYNLKDQVDVLKGRNILLQTELNNLKNQVDTLKETEEFLQFQRRCFNEKGIYQEETVTKNQYCLMKSSLTWSNGKTKCQSLKAHLLEINSKAEQNWLTDKVSGEKWWTGGIKDRSRNVWIWEHSGTDLEFTNWDSAGPQPGGGKDENCILSQDGLWHDYPCNDTFYIICEKGK